MSLSPNQRISKEFSLIKKKGVYTFICQPQNYLPATREMLKYLIKKRKLSGIYVTLNRSCRILASDLAKSKIGPERLLFIDGTEESHHLKNCLPIHSNQSLTELSLALTEAGKNKTVRFIFFDSLSTLLVYNLREITERFLHFIINKNKEREIIIIFISLDEERSNKIIPFLSQLCDKCIRV